jgi:putative protease
MDWEGFQAIVWIRSAAMEKEVGKISHYYDRISVAVVQLTGELKLGDEIHILGRVTDFTQYVNSMEINHQKVESAGRGMEIALKVEDYAHRGDVIFKSN